MNNQESNEINEPINLKPFYYVAGSGALLSIMGITSMSFGTFSDTFKEYVSNKDLITYGLKTFCAGYAMMLGSTVYYAFNEIKNRKKQSNQDLESMLQNE